MIEAYPLTWPEGWPRRPSHQRSPSRYEVTFLKARDHLARQLELAGARNVVISTNVPLRRDGLPLANMREPEDSGVAIYWDDRKRRPRVIACDSWRTVRENLRAVGLTVEALRTIERTGATELLERAYSGFARLPEAADCWSILGIPKGSPANVVTDRYRELARQHHPDHGGDNATMARINAAYQEAVRA
jgi:hypothetical protein